MKQLKMAVLAILMLVVVGFAVSVVVAQPPPPGPSPNVCPIDGQTFSSFAEATAHQYTAHFSDYVNKQQLSKVYSLIDGAEFSTVNEVASYILTTYSSLEPPLSATYCPFDGEQITSSVTDNDQYKMYVHWTTTHDWWPATWEPPQEMGWPGGMSPPSDWTPPATWDVPENLLKDVVPPWMPDNSWMRPENWTPRSDWMPSGSWKNSRMPSEDMPSTSVPLSLNPEENHWVSPENKPFWTWQEDNVTTGAPVGFSISEDSKPFMRSTDNGTWAPAEVTAENVTVGGLRMNVTENAADVVITTLLLEPEDLPQNSPPPGENYYEFFQVGTNIPTLIENAEIGVKVDQDWIAANNLDDNSITLEHLVDGAWTDLPTEIAGEDANYLYLSAQTPSFSVFAVTGETAATGGTTVPGVSPTELPIIAIAAAAIMGLAVVAVWRIRGKK